MKGMEEYKHLSYASTLCGNCTEVCPLKINIHSMLLANRQEAVKEHLNGFQENMGWTLWQKGMMNRKLIGLAGQGVKNKVFHSVFSKSWANRREEIEFPKQTFQQMFADKNKVSK